MQRDWWRSISFLCSVVNCMFDVKNKIELKNVISQTQYIVVLDLEMTCREDDSMAPMEREIIEIGAVLLDSESLDILSEFQSFVRPIQHPILTDFCKSLTHITQEQVFGAESFLNVFQEFLKWFPKGQVSVITWGSYDITQINIDCDNAGLWPFTPDNRIYPVNLKKVFAKDRKIKQLGLKKAMEIMGLTMDGVHHRALDDALNTTDLLKVMLSMVENLTI